MFNRPNTPLAQTVFIFLCVYWLYNWEIIGELLWYDCTIRFSALISRANSFMGGHMPGFDRLIKHVGVIQDFNDRVLQVQDTGLIVSEKGVGT